MRGRVNAIRTFKGLVADLRIKRICEQILPKYSIPKLFIPIDQIPLTETGKVARAEAQTIAENNDVISNKNQ